VIVLPAALRRVPLSLDTVLAVVRWQQAEPHPVLTTTPAWRHPDTAGELDRHAREELMRHGLHDGRRPLPEFDDMVGALVRPERELYGWVTTTVDGRLRRYSLLAASAYKSAFVLVRLYDPDHVVLAAIQPSRVASAFAGELPNVRAAQGNPVSVAYQTYLTATTDDDGFSGFAASENPDAQELTSVLSRPRLGAGELYAATRRAGTRRRIDRPVMYLDTADGRWLAERRTTDHDDIVSLTPASAEQIIAALTR
jgi:regulator of extracellular matrix RemA (YlzA/DUF370 family)